MWAAEGEGEHGRADGAAKELGEDVGDGRGEGYLTACPEAKGDGGVDV